MRDMAQLRLQTEVSQLEGSVQAADHPSLPPYLVPDACVLCDSLALLKQLASSARFIVIIPLVGAYVFIKAPSSITFFHSSRFRLSSRKIYPI